MVATFEAWKRRYLSYAIQHHDFLRDKLSNLLHMYFSQASTNFSANLELRHGILKPRPSSCTHPILQLRNGGLDLSDVLQIMRLLWHSKDNGSLTTLISFSDSVRPKATLKEANADLALFRLIIGGKVFGPHPFVCQIRDMKTHEPLEGVHVGDIGPKFGYNTMDNGFLLFNRKSSISWTVSHTSHVLRAVYSTNCVGRRLLRRYCLDSVFLHFKTKLIREYDFRRSHSTYQYVGKVLFR
jgi:hypothetical protein